MDEELFHWAEAPQALRANVAQLCADADVARESLEGQPLAALFEIACRTYGEHSLPEFWRIWKDWQDGDEIQPMGDL